MSCHLEQSNGARPGKLQRLDHRHQESGQSFLSCHLPCPTQELYSVRVRATPPSLSSYVTSFFKNFDIFIDYAITVVPFPPLHSTPSCPPLPSHILPPIVHVHGSYLQVLWLLHFLILFLLFPCLFSTYHLCYLFSVPFPPLSPSQSPIDNPPCDLHFCGSVSVLVVCLVFFCFGFRCGC